MWFDLEILHAFGGDCILGAGNLQRHCIMDSMNMNINPVHVSDWASRKASRQVGIVEARFKEEQWNSIIGIDESVLAIFKHG